MGFIFQSYNLLPVYTVFENVELPLILNKIDSDDRIKKVNQAIEWVGLTGKRDSKPNMLSGGECQRTAIARAIVHQPVLVMADEPTANLDAENSHNIMKILKKLNKELDTSFVFATHDEKIMGYLKRIIRLEDGNSSKMKNKKRRFLMLFKIAFKNLLGAKLRTFLNVFVTSISFFMIIFVSGLYDGMRQHAKQVTIDTEIAGGAYWHPMYDPMDPLLFEDAHSTLPLEIEGLVQEKKGRACSSKPGSNLSSWSNYACCNERNRSKSKYSKYAYESFR